MIKKVFVGNLPWSVRTEGLSNLLSELGIIYRSAKVIEDRDTGQSRGFGFVEVNDDEEMRRAISALSGHVVDGRPLNANEAKPRPVPGGGSVVLNLKKTQEFDQFDQAWNSENSESETGQRRRARGGRARREW